MLTATRISTISHIKVLIFLRIDDCFDGFSLYSQRRRLSSTLRCGCLTYARILSGKGWTCDFVGIGGRRRVRGLAIVAVEL